MRVLFLPVQRNRLLYLLLLVLTVAAGLASRHIGDVLPVFIATYAGDTLWALMVYLLVGLMFNRLPIFQVASAALVFSVAVECSQLYHAPWIDGIRHTRIGGLVLGFGFLWSDLLCYMMGVLAGIALELILFLKKKF